MPAHAMLEYADFCFENQDFGAAAMEYKRFIFFFPDDPRAVHADFQTGMCRFYEHDFGAALEIFSRIFSHDIASDPVSDPASAWGLPAGLMISRCYEKLQKYRAATEHLLFMEKQVQAPQDRDRVYYRLGWVFLAAGESQRAVQAFSKITTRDPASDFTAPTGLTGQAGAARLPGQNRMITGLQKDLEQWDRIPRKNPVFAGMFSIVPGGGYLYCGRWRDALTAFVLNFALAYGAVECFDRDLYAAGGIFSVIGAGFYAGSIYGGISSAHKFNQAGQDGFVRELKKKYPPALKPDLTPDLTPALSFRFAPRAVVLGFCLNF